METAKFSKKKKKKLSEVAVKYYCFLLEVTKNFFQREKYMTISKIRCSMQTEETIFGLKICDHIPDFELTYGVIRSKQPGDDCCDKNKIYLLLKQHCQKSYTRQSLLNMILNACFRKFQESNRGESWAQEPSHVSSPVSKQMPPAIKLWFVN